MVIELKINWMRSLRTLLIALISCSFFNIGATANCPAPTNFNAQITGNNANLTWTPAPGATSYEVGYFNQSDGSSGMAITGGSSHVFATLTPGIYQFWIKSLCLDGSVSKAIIIMEEIDGAIQVLFDCLCDELETKLETSEYDIKGDWIIEEPPCKTQYNFTTSMYTVDGKTERATLKFSRNDELLSGMINNCESENLPLINLENTKEYNGYDELGKRLYTLSFEEGSFKVSWNGKHVKSYDFDLSNCTVCPQSQDPPSNRNSLIDLETSLEEAMQTMPNPFTNELRITWNQAVEGAVDIKVYNAAGQLMTAKLDELHKEGKQQMLLNTEGWPIGIYVIILKTNNVNSESKVIKMQ